MSFHCTGVYPLTHTHTHIYIYIYIYTYLYSAAINAREIPVSYTYYVTLNESALI